MSHQPNSTLNPAGSTFEWTGFGAVPAVLGADAGTPGRVTRQADGRVLAMHYAPRRWLLPAPDAALLKALGFASGDGVLTEVSGKWRELVVAGAASPVEPVHPLRLSFDCDRVLGGRDCAALTLLDCPVIAVRDGRDLSLWFEASFEASLVTAVARYGVSI
jgi:hypothetical protein